MGRTDEQMEEIMDGLRIIEGQIRTIHEIADAAGVPYGVTAGPQFGRALSAADVPYGVTAGPQFGRALSAAERVKMLAERVKGAPPQMVRPEWDSFLRRMHGHVTTMPDGYACNGCGAPIKGQLALREHWTTGHFDTVPAEQAQVWP